MGDTSKHLTYFKVENFKRFESFEMRDLGQFNLIVGDNNVGKTSVLEALLVCEPAWVFVNRLFVALSYRKIKKQFAYGDIEFYLNKTSSDNNKIQNKISFDSHFSDATKQTIFLEFENDKRYIAVRGIPNDSTGYSMHDRVSVNTFFNTPFIPFFKGHDQDLNQFYSQLQKNRSQKKNFIKCLNTIVPDLEDIELSIPASFNGYNDTIEPALIVSQKNIDSTLPLAMFGDGILKLFRLLAEIVINNGTRLMIDEIDTGIYFNRFRGFWKVILQTAKDNDVQLFMTTHNEECIKYFKEVLEMDLPDLQKDVRSITLVENKKTKLVTAHTYNFEQFEHALAVGNEVRA
jgi:AAA15 family ATPase/GTPase